MEDSEHSSKRSKRPGNPEGIPQQRSGKRQRQNDPDDFKPEDSDIEDNAPFPLDQEVKDALKAEASLLQIPVTFEEVDPEHEKLLPVCPTKHSLQKFIDDSSAQQIHNVTDNDPNDKCEDLPVLDDERPSRMEVTDVDSEEAQTTLAIANPPTAVGPFFAYRPMTWPHENDQDQSNLPHQSTTEGWDQTGEEGRPHSWIDSSEELKEGSLWSQLRKEHLPTLLTDPRFVLRSAEVERDDFLKACMRLQHIAHPARLSDLLGNASRPTEYCKFVLNFFLDLYNSEEVRTKIDRKQLCFKKYCDLDVYHDGNYADNDIIIRRLDYLQRRRKARRRGEALEPQNAKTKGDTYQEEMIRLTEERLAEESDEEEPEAPKHLSQRLQLDDSEMDQFCDLPSYIVRSYMYNISGETFQSVDEFAKYCQKQGISFKHSEQSGVGDHCDRLKWIHEPVLAPTLGSAKTVKEPLQLWQHAINNFSVMNLARCALIQTEPLLDWLEYATRLKNNPTTVEEFYMFERPVVCLAPVAVLYLADVAAAFALELLQEAIRIAENDELDGERGEEEKECLSKAQDAMDTAANPAEEQSTGEAESDEECMTVVEMGDVQKAFTRKMMNVDKQSFCYLSHYSPIDSLPGGLPNARLHQTEWPQRKIRPYTTSQEFELCCTVPVSKVIVPDSAMEETRAVVMGIKSKYHLDLYTKGMNQVSASDARKTLHRTLSREEVKRHNKEARESWDSVLTKAGSVRKPDRKRGKANHDGGVGLDVTKSRGGRHGEKRKPKKGVAIHDSEASTAHDWSRGGGCVTRRQGDGTAAAQRMHMLPSGEDKCVPQQKGNTEVQDVQTVENIVNKGADGKGQTAGEGKAGGCDIEALARGNEEDVGKGMREDAKCVAGIVRSDSNRSNDVAQTDVALAANKARQECGDALAPGASVVAAKQAASNGSGDVSRSENKCANDSLTENGVDQQRSVSNKYTEFFGITNRAESILARFDVGDWRKMEAQGLQAIRAAVKGEAVPKHEQQCHAPSENKNDNQEDDIIPQRASSLCHNRLRRIVLHAIGMRVKEKLSAQKPLGYASTANYSTYNALECKRRARLTQHAFEMLAQLTERVVRDEAEMLMECAAHDDGRPWIDHADVALVHAVRKKSFPYGTL